MEAGDGFVLAEADYDDGPVVEKLRALGVEFFLHRKGCRNRDLNAEKAMNKLERGVHSCTEHVYGWKFRCCKWGIRSIGMASAQRCIGLASLVYNMNRFTLLIRETG